MFVKGPLWNVKYAILSYPVFYIYLSILTALIVYIYLSFSIPSLTSSFLSVCFRAAPSMKPFHLGTKADTCWTLPQRQKPRPRWAPILLPVAPLRSSTGNELSAPTLDTSHSKILCQSARTHLCLGLVLTSQLITAHVNTCCTWLLILSKCVPLKYLQAPGGTAKRCA